MTARESRPAFTNRAAKITGGRSGVDSTAPREPSAWLRAAVARRVAQVKAQGLDPHDPDGPLIVAPLGRTGGDDEHRCDRCQTDCREGGRLWCGAVEVGSSLRLVIGLCPVCADLEGIEGGDPR